MSLDINTLRTSFEKAKPLGIQITEKFYEILFRDYPQSKSLFDESRLPTQKKQLLAALVFVVDNLENTDLLVKKLSEMGGRHKGYGVKDEHYDWVGSSLLNTFEFFFKENWTPELKKAWTDAYGVIASIMKQGASQAT
ncbi:MAG: globin family protein [Bdellovibrionota bacterium]